MRHLNLESGFSAVELLITLFIGFLFIVMGYQLHSAAIQNGSEARELSTATNIAYEELRRIQMTKTAFVTCPGTRTIDSNVDEGAATMKTTFSCPFPGALPDMRLVVIRVQYNVSKREVTHAMYISQQ
jgi:hypothetical protein